MKRSLTTLNSTDFPALAMVRTGRRVRRIGRITMAVLIVSTLAMFFVPWRQTAPGSGVVVALDPQQRRQTISSPTKGVIDFVKPTLREGSRVEGGELLMKLAPFAAEGVSQLDFQIAAIESKEASAKASLQVAQQSVLLQQQSGESMTESLKQDLEAARQKWNQSKAEVASSETVVSDKENQYRIAEEVARRGLIPKEELFTKEQAAAGARAKLDKARNAVQEVYANLLSKEEEIESKLREIDIKNRSANQKVLEEMQKLNTIEKELLESQNKRGEFDRLEVRAPRGGFIQQWFGLAGSDAVKEGDSLFVMVPDADVLAVELSVRGNDMPLVHSGDAVRLQFEGWPAVQFPGWPSIAKGTFGGEINRLAPTDDGKGNFRILVVPDDHFEGDNGWPDDRYLRQGVRANGWVMLETVPLGQEIWRQFNGFPPTIADPMTSGKAAKPSKVKLPK